MLRGLCLIYIAEKLVRLACLHVCSPNLGGLDDFLINLKWFHPMGTTNSIPGLSPFYTSLKNIQSASRKICTKRVIILICDRHDSFMSAYSCCGVLRCQCMLHLASYCMSKWKILTNWNIISIES